MSTVATASDAADLRPFGGRTAARADCHGRLTRSRSLASTPRADADAGSFASLGRRRDGDTNRWRTILGAGGRQCRWHLDDDVDPQNRRLPN